MTILVGELGCCCCCWVFGVGGLDVGVRVDALARATTGDCCSIVVDATVVTGDVGVTVVVSVVVVDGLSTNDACCALLRVAESCEADNSLDVSTSFELDPVDKAIVSLPLPPLLLLLMPLVAPAPIDFSRATVCFILKH